MKKNLFIHIGFGKTGTTSLQNFCNSERRRLSKEGILYPLAGQSNSGHHLLASLHDEKIHQTVVAQYEKLINEIHASSCGKIVISSENFCFLRSAYVSQIEKFLHEFNTNIVFYYRPQHELIESTYLEWVKTNKKYTKTIDQFFKVHAKGFDFNLRLAPWSETFGEDHILIRSYDASANGTFDSRIDFLEAIHAPNRLISYAIRSKHNRLNQSLSPEFCKLITLLDNLQPDALIRQEMISEMIELSKKLSPQKTTPLVSPKLKKEIEAYYKNPNKIFLKQFGDRNV